jgi:thiol-disulfide isomerase/thioredoxin
MKITLLILMLGTFGFSQKLLNYETKKEVKLSTLMDERIYVDVWATWCMPCIKSLPVLNELNKKKGVTIIALNAQGDIPKVQKFIEKYEVKLPVWINPDKKYLDQLSPPALPSIYLVDKNGKVIRKLEGYSKTELEEFVK